MEIDQMIKEIESPVILSNHSSSPERLAEDSLDRITYSQYEAIVYRNPEIVGWLAIDMEKMHRNCAFLRKG